MAGEGLESPIADRRHSAAECSAVRVNPPAGKRMGPPSRGLLQRAAGECGRPWIGRPRYFQAPRFYRCPASVAGSRLGHPRSVIMARIFRSKSAMGKIPGNAGDDRRGRYPAVESAGLVALQACRDAPRSEGEPGCIGAGETVEGAVAFLPAFETPRLGSRQNGRGL